MRSTEKPRTVDLTTGPPSTDYVRMGRSYGFVNEWGTARYKAKKGRAVRKAERPTYDRAAAAMLAGLIHGWHVYEDGWVFDFADGDETEPMTLNAAGFFLDATVAVRLAA